VKKGRKSERRCGDKKGNKEPEKSPGIELYSFNIPSLKEMLT
jgi:hypothetical protein